MLLPPSLSRTRFRVPRVLRGLVLLLGLAPAALVAASKWPPLDPADLAAKTSRIDAEAGAEILLREVEMDDADPILTAIDTFVRIKIYSERSLEKLAKIEITYSRDDQIQYLAARTHRPDGTIVELSRKDIFDREVVKSGDYRQKVKAFAPPGLQVGAILEYRYTRIVYDGIGGFPFSFQADHPTRLVRFRLRPFSHPEVSARVIAFSYPNPISKPDGDGYYKVELNDVPARVDEPWRPPSIQTEPTLLLYYSDYRGGDPVKHWNKRAAELYSESQSATKPGKGVRAAVEGLVTASDDDETKLRKIYDFCRSRIKNRNLESSGFTDEQRARFRTESSPEATLKAGHGTSRDLTTLFIAMARAAGLDARYAWCNDCSSIPFNVQMASRFALSDLVAAVKIGDAWRYCDPARIFLPPGTLSWENSGTAILVADKTAGKIGMTPIAIAEASLCLRTGTLALQADGTLEGDVKIDFTGHREAEERNRYDGKTPKALAALIADSVRDDQPLAEVTAVKVLNADNPLAPLSVNFHLRIPEYAERTGSRLFLQPAVFHKGTKAVFEAATRKTDIQMRYRYTTDDRIAITLPENFELEAPSAPPELELPKIAHYKVEIALRRDQRVLQYHRIFYNNMISFPVKYYGAFKSFFDTIHNRDNHVLTLKRVTAAAKAAAPSGAATATNDSAAR